MVSLTKKEPWTYSICDYKEEVRVQLLSEAQGKLSQLQNALYKLENKKIKNVQD